MRTIIVLCFIVFCTFSQPGLRFSISEKYINSFLQQQIPRLLPKSINISEISKHTIHSNFLANITNVSIANLDLDYLDTFIASNEKENKLSLKISISFKNFHFFLNL